MLTSEPQNFIQFDCASPKDEVDKRFHFFTTQVPVQSFRSCHNLLTRARFCRVY